MEKLYNYFPLSAAVKVGDVKSLLISLLIYLAASGLMGILDSVLGWIPIVGWLLGIIFWVLGIYCVAGIVLSILKFFQK